ncbi:hypothetical protein GS504_24245 [Rhodococcus hoagii]|nr:hypothetical protein [Prescottella equi]NKR72940.1 hypothetical protein [Prescottella equi]NKS56130.1 hypothetical protein [Prescottella equi]NKS60566.1 hypothetical protein [Prescottella equi]NKU54955.1 hypothetical protein [Prescottella equi]
MIADNHDEALDELLEALPQLDGFEPWCEVGPEQWQRSHGSHATAYIEFTGPGSDSTAAHLIALPTNPTPVFDDGAAADRAHDAAVDQQNGVL